MSVRRVMLLSLVVLGFVQTSLAGRWEFMTTFKGYIDENNPTSVYAGELVMTCQNHSSTRDRKVYFAITAPNLFAEDRIPDSTIVTTKDSIKFYVTQSEDGSNVSATMEAYMLWKPIVQDQATWTWWNKGSTYANWGTVGAANAYDDATVASFNSSDSSGYDRTATCFGTWTIAEANPVNQWYSAALDTHFVNTVIRAGSNSGYVFSILFVITSAGTDFIKICGDTRSSGEGGGCNGNSLSFIFNWTDAAVTEPPSGVQHSPTGVGVRHGSAGLSKRHKP